MATNHTTNYQLNLWEPGDSFLRTEFNENTTKLDAAIKAEADARAAALAAQNTVLSDKLRLVTGSYTGTGKYGADHPNSITIPNAERPPRFILVQGEGQWSRLFLIRGETKTEPFCWDGHSYEVTITWTNTGVSWYQTTHANYQLNTKGILYHYIALI